MPRWPGAVAFGLAGVGVALLSACEPASPRLALAPDATVLVTADRAATTAFDLIHRATCLAPRPAPVRSVAIRPDGLEYQFVAPDRAWEPLALFLPFGHEQSFGVGWDALRLHVYRLPAEHPILPRAWVVTLDGPWDDVEGIACSTGALLYADAFDAARLVRALELLRAGRGRPQEAIVPPSS